MKNPPLKFCAIFFFPIEGLSANGISLPAVDETRRHLEKFNRHIGFLGPGVGLWVIFLCQVGILLMGVIQGTAKDINLPFDYHRRHSPSRIGHVRLLLPCVRYGVIDLDHSGRKKERFRAADGINLPAYRSDGESHSRGRHIRLNRPRVGLGVILINVGKGFKVICCSTEGIDFVPHCGSTEPESALCQLLLIRPLILFGIIFSHNFARNYQIILTANGINLLIHYAGTESPYSSRVGTDLRHIWFLFPLSCKAYCRKAKQSAHY